MADKVNPENNYAPLDKYAPMFFPLHPEPYGGPDNPPKLVFRGDKDIPGAVLNAGVVIITEPHVEISEPHYHPDADEYLPIMGAGLPDVFASWDAEVHFYMGPSLDKMEKVVITDPTMVKIPRGWWHGPLEFVRVDKPIFFEPTVLGRNGDYVKLVDDNGTQKRMVFGIDDPEAANYKSVPWTVVNEDGVDSYTDKGTYVDTKAPSGDDCILMEGMKSKPYTNAQEYKAPKPALSEEVAENILALPREITYWGECMPCPQTYYRGKIYHEAATYNIGFQIYGTPMDAEVPHFHWAGDEYLFFLSGDPFNPTEFGCEVEMPLGPDPDHYEVGYITTPTIVRIPANTWHAPIKFRNMTKPIMFQAGFLAGDWGVISRGPDRVLDPNDHHPHHRTKVYEYMGDDTRMCKYNEKKRCNICAKCFRKPEEYLTEEQLKEGKF